MPDSTPFAPRLADLTERFANWTAPTHKMLPFGARIYFLRVRKELSLEELAERSGLTVEVIDRIEGGRNARFAEMVKLAKALEIGMGELVEDLEHVGFGPPPATQQPKGKTPKRGNPKLRARGRSLISFMGGCDARGLTRIG